MIKFPHGNNDKMRKKSESFKFCLNEIEFENSEVESYGREWHPFERAKDKQLCSCQRMIWYDSPLN